MAAGLSAFFLVCLARTAWVSDDAYITFRTVDNVAHGFGPRYNLAERVQTFTNPLWMLALVGARFVVGNVYYAALGLSALLALSTVLVIALDGGARGGTALLAALVLVLSKSFVDYSTSGLENPLGHFLLVLFGLAALGRLEGARRALAVGFLAALVGLNRLDELLLVAPTVALAFATLPRATALRTAVLAFLPLLVWELFGIVYYGFPFPNTAYVKLASGVDRAELVRHGFRYLLDLAHSDPVAAVGIVLGPILAFASRDRGLVALAVGAVAYVAYVVAIGGDFMSTRFFTGVLVVSVVCIARSRLSSPTIVGAGVAAVLLAAALTPLPAWSSGPDYGSTPRTTRSRDLIRDERAISYATTGLLRSNGGKDPSVLGGPSVDLGRRARMDPAPIVVPFALGFVGYVAGPQVHLVDRYALTDAFIARMPAERRSWWQPGHIFRAIPEGYIDTLRTGVNQIRDPDLARYFDAMSRVTRGPLLSRRRFEDIWKLNTRQLDSLIDVERYARPGIQAVGGDRLDQRKVGGESVAIPDEGLWINLGVVCHGASIDIELSPNADLQLRIGRGDDPVDSGQIWGDFQSHAPFEWRSGRVSSFAVGQGYDRIELYPARRRGEALIRSMRIDGC